MHTQHSAFAGPGTTGYTAAQEHPSDLTPSIVRTRPKVVLGLLALVLSQLIHMAHPHERGWDFASGFMLGFSIAMMVSALIEQYRKRD